MSASRTPISRILLAATGLELIGLAAACSALGLLGARSGLFDALNNFAPVWCALAVLGGILAWIGLGPRPARRTALIAAVLAAVVSGAPIAWEVAAGLGHARLASDARPLKVVTFNASAESYDGALGVAEVMKSDPDVFAIQEPVIFRMAEDRLAAAYPYSVTCPPPTSCPLAIWSKRPILRSGFIVKREGKAGWNDIDLLWAETTAPDGGRFILATTHFLWPLPPPPQRIQRDLLARQARQLPPGDVVLTGDLNLTPWSFGLRRLDRGLRPLKRRTHAVFTWPAFVPRVFTPLPWPVLAIDHVYASPAWRTVAVRRLGRAASDHLPVEATFVRTPLGHAPP